MANLTSKELSQLEDQLNGEALLVSKFRNYANQCADPDMIRSVLNIQEAYAKSLLVNREELRRARMTNDVMAAEAAVREAFETDVRPLLEEVREEMGLQPDPMKAYLESGYAEKILSRGIGGSSW